jgi:hypothetical protein
MTRVRRAECINSFADNGKFYSGQHLRDKSKQQFVEVACEARGYESYGRNNYNQLKNA